MLHLRQSAYGKELSQEILFSSIQGDDESKEASIKLSSIMKGVEAKRAKRYQKKLAECFLCYGLHKLRDCPE
ncbi:hypothetical protein J1N35_021400 [Gossypium stocksii]|uniref:Uncharacterized protein n=1 Tax=Gossypium stocksii TaxID=47602 RepID=A0A9D4A2D9_9ROSI|nr:hypothetical protein J1N35_021400 [Gossypium stocksii]